MKIVPSTTRLASPAIIGRRAACALLLTGCLGSNGDAFQRLARDPVHLVAQSTEGQWLASSLQHLLGRVEGGGGCTWINPPGSEDDERTEGTGTPSPLGDDDGSGPSTPGVDPTSSPNPTSTIDMGDPINAKGYTAGPFWVVVRDTAAGGLYDTPERIKPENTGEFWQWVLYTSGDGLLLAIRSEDAEDPEFQADLASFRSEAAFYEVNVVPTAFDAQSSWIGHSDEAISWVNSMSGLGFSQVAIWSKPEENPDYQEGGNNESLLSSFLTLVSDVSNVVGTNNASFVMDAAAHKSETGYTENQVNGAPYANQMTTVVHIEEVQGGSWRDISDNGRTSIAYHVEQGGKGVVSWIQLYATIPTDYTDCITIEGDDGSGSGSGGTMETNPKCSYADYRGLGELINDVNYWGSTWETHSAGTYQGLGASDFDSLVGMPDFYSVIEQPTQVATVTESTVQYTVSTGNFDFRGEGDNIPFLYPRTFEMRLYIDGVEASERAWVDATDSTWDITGYISKSTGTFRIEGRTGESDLVPSGTTGVFWNTGELTYVVQ